MSVGWLDLSRDNTLFFAVRVHTHQILPVIGKLMCCMYSVYAVEQRLQKLSNNLISHVAVMSHAVYFNARTASLNALSHDDDKIQSC